MATQLVIGWFRNDLRLRDNPMLQLVIERATEQNLPAILVYILDQRFYDKSLYGRVTDPSYAKSISTRKQVDFGSRKCDCRRARFYLNVLRDLQRGLREIGTELLIFHGKPEEVFAKLQDDFGKLEVICLREPVSPVWTVVEDLVDAALMPKGSSLTRLWGAMSLYHKDDLPFSLEQSPGNYSGLCYTLGWEDIWTGLNQTQDATPIRQPLQALPGSWAVRAPSAEPKSGLEAVSLDDDRKYLERLGYSVQEIDTTLKAPHGGSRKGKGGETAAWTRLAAWMEKDAAVETKDDKFVPLGNSFGAAGAAYLEEGVIDAFQWKNLSKPTGWMQLSKYLACGCISPREIFYTLTNRSEPHWATAGVVHRLMWREWHRMNAIKYHRRLYWLQGPGKQNMIWKQDDEAARRWKDGKTGIPYIDACMRELNETGWLAYKGRKTVATFLAIDLWLDWRIGGFHFEEMLLDYDVAMNYGNWAFCARVDKNYHGTDFRDSTHWDLIQNIRAEAANDPEAHYIKQWVPELRAVDPKYVHTPWMMKEDESQKVQCVIGTHYPKPLVPEKKLQFLAHEDPEIEMQD